MSQIQIGDKVIINSFKNKNQEGYVKFVGEVEGKIGQWVGVELDEPKGDMDGTLNGMVLFECNPGFGLLLRVNQVKVISQSTMDSSKAPPFLDVGDILDVGDSPLVTPKEPPPKFKLQQQMQQMISQVAAQAQEGGETGGKTLNWKERLEKLREQKTKKKQDDTEEKDVPPTKEQEEQDDLKKMFAPATGINRTKEGKLVVDKEEVKAMQKEVEPVLEPSPKVTRQQDDTQKPATSGLASRLGGGIGKGLRGPTKSISQPAQEQAKPAAVAKPTAAETAKEKLQKKSEEMKEKLAQKSTELGKGTKTLPGLKKLESTKPSVDQQKAESEKPVGSTLASKIGLKKLATTVAAEKSSGIQRPGTARGSKQEEEKKEDKKIAEPAKKAVGSIGARSALQKKITTKPEDISQKVVEEIKEREEEDESLLNDSEGSPLRSPIKSPPRVVEQQKSSEQQPIIVPNFGGVSQVEHKKLEAQLRKKNDEAYALQIEVRELSSKIESLQEASKQKLEEIEEEYQVKLERLQAQLSDNSVLEQLEGEAKERELQLKQQLQASATEKELEVKEKEIQMKAKGQELQEQAKEKEQQLQSQAKDREQQLIQQAKDKEQSLMAEIEELKKQKKEQEDLVKKQTLEIEEHLNEKKKLLSEIEAKNVDIESIQLELDIMRDEKEELINQLKMSEEISQGDSLTGLNEDELRQQNNKLRQAVTALNMNYEVEKSKLESKIMELEERAKLVEDYEKRLEDMDLLIEEVELKEAQRLEMEQKVDEVLGYEEMVEEMTQEIFQKEEEIEELSDRIRELEEVNGIAEELNENQESLVKELNGELAEKDATISNLQNNEKQLEELVLDMESQINKYKERCSDLKQKAKMLEEELQAAYSTGDQKVKISTLLEKQNQLITKLRENSKKELELNVFKIDYWQEKFKTKIVQSFIPQRLVDESRLDSVEKVQLLNKTKHKAILLIREICEKQLPQLEQTHEDAEQRIGYKKLLVTLCEEATKLIDSSQRIMYCIYNMPTDKFSDCTTKLMAWNKFVTLNQFMDKILELFKEEALTAKFDLSIFTGSLKSIQDLQSNVEYKFIEKPEFEKVEGQETSDIEVEATQASMERKRLVKYCGKLNLRNEAIKMALAVVLLSKHESQSINNELKQKCGLIYWRLIDIVLKIDEIDGENSGEEYLNLEEIGTDTRLSQKYNTLKSLWHDNNESSEGQEKDWVSVLEAIERDITTLNNDYKFKKLVQKVEDNNKEQKLDDIYKKDWDSKGPWTLIASQIRADLEDTGTMKDRIESLQEKVKEQTLQYLMLKKQKDDTFVVNQSLEIRLADAQTRAEKVPALEIEKKRLFEKENHLNLQIDQAKKEIESLREKEKELKKQLQEAQEKQESPSKGMARRPTGASPSSKKAAANKIFKFLPQMQLMGKKDSTTPSLSRTSSISNSELQKHLQQNEEVYTNIILELQSDRMKLRGQNMMKRLNKLSNSDGALNVFIQKQRERKEMQIRLSKEEQGMLENAMSNVDLLKSKVKREMVAARVIDLRAQKSNQQAKVEEAVKIGQEKINYLIIKAKEEVNDAVKVLFSKDSKFHQIRSLRDLNQKGDSVGSTDDFSRVQIGSLKLIGQVPNLNQKKVLTLNSDVLNDLKRNLALFANT